jgi:death-on-curing protein
VPSSAHTRAITHEIYQKAAALVQSVAGNHGFADGNKRTTLILVQTLLTKSGYDLCDATGEESIQDAAEQMVLDVVTGSMSLSELTAWFKERTRKL